MPATSTVVGPTVVCTGEVDRPYLVSSPNSTVTFPASAGCTTYSATRGLVVAETLEALLPQPASNVIRMQGTRVERWVLFKAGAPRKEGLRVSIASVLASHTARQT